MNVTSILGLLLYAGIAAAFAALAFRILGFGHLTVFVAAMCTTLATLAFHYASTGKTEAFSLLSISLLFGVAWFSAVAVQIVTKRIRGD